MRARCHLREFRERQDVGIRTLAKRVTLKSGKPMNHGVLSQIERGQLLPPDELISQLEELYGHPMTEWYDWHGPFVAVGMDEHKPGQGTDATRRAA